MSAGDKIGFGLAVAVAVFALSKQIALTVERIDDANACRDMNSSCPIERRSVLVRGTNIICTCNEDRPKP